MWERIVGHDQVKTILRRALRAERVGHAYLFMGPKGVGKATVARVLALNIVCGCLECPSCLRVLAGAHPDVTEVHPVGLSFRIKQIRELNANVLLGPVEASRKVYVLHNVEKLTAEATNSFLRTLEEPPPSVVFILLADSTNILSTIISRCQVLRFGPLSLTETMAVLQKVAPLAERPMDAARLSLGSPGEALRHLESAGSERALAMLELAVKLPHMRTAERLQWMSRLEAEKEELHDYVAFLALWMRDVLCYKLGVAGEVALPHEYELRRQASEQKMADIVGRLKQLQGLLTVWGSNINKRMVIDQLLLVRK